MEDAVFSEGVDEDSNIDLINRIINYTKRNPEITIKETSKAFAMSERKLQGLFENYVGIGLKWIMLRERLIKAMIIAEEPDTPKWTQVASDLGYSDQAHFSNDFKRIIGSSPSEAVRH